MKEMVKHNRLRLLYRKTGYVMNIFLNFLNVSQNQIISK